MKFNRILKQLCEGKEIFTLKCGKKKVIGTFSSEKKAIDAAIEDGAGTGQKYYVQDSTGRIVWTNDDKEF